MRIEEGISVDADPPLVEIVLENLVRNAWKFSSKRADASIEFGSQRHEAGAIGYYVRDNGAGFDMAYAQKLFGVFQRLHRESEFTGTGVGLATVKRIIDRHGGRVWAESEPGRGATFHFTLNE
jgi:light-regulated signal transduction histidine kinase (bacteriophytochrome)